MNKKIIIFITLFIIVLIPTYKVEAKTLGDLRKELSNLEAKYEENKNNKKFSPYYFLYYKFFLITLDNNFVFLIFS